VIKALAKIYQSFQAIADMDRSVRQFVQSTKLGKTILAVLQVLVRHSCKIIGVSWLKAESIATIIEKSDKTVRRSLSKLEDLGIIKRIQTIKPSGGRGVDLCVIQPLGSENVQASTENVQSIIEKVSSRVEAERPAVSTANDAKIESETSIFKAKNIKTRNINTYVRKDANSVQSLDASFIPSNVPNEFVSTVKPFYPFANTIYKLWGTARAAASKMGLLDVPRDLAVDAFKQAVFAFKAKRVKTKDIGGYFYGTLVGMIGNASKMDKPYPEFYNWLEA
jgi:predicted transcriptional regulator